MLLRFIDFSFFFFSLFFFNETQIVRQVPLLMLLPGLTKSDPKSAALVVEIVAAMCVSNLK